MTKHRVRIYNTNAAQRQTYKAMRKKRGATTHQARTLVNKMQGNMPSRASRTRGKPHMR